MTSAVGDAKIGATALSGTNPIEPVVAPTLWTLAAAARRELGCTPSTFAPAATATSEAVASTSSAEAAGVQTPAAGEPTDAAVVNDVPDWQDLYTGKPSFVHDVVVVGLKALQFVLKPLGGLLSLTRLRIPVVTDGIPPFRPPGVTVKRTEFDGMPVWTLTPKAASGKVAVALHGGAYVGQVSIFHWWTYTDMARDSGATSSCPYTRWRPKGPPRPRCRAYSRWIRCVCGIMFSLRAFRM